MIIENSEWLWCDTYLNQSFHLYWNLEILMLFLLFKSKNKLDAKAEKPYSSCSSLDSGLFDTSFYLQVHRTSIFFPWMLYPLITILYIVNRGNPLQAAAASSTWNGRILPLLSPSSLIGNYQGDYYQVMNKFNNTVSLFKRQAWFYLLLAKKASKFWNFNKDGSFGSNIYHITVVLNFKSSILLGSLSPSTLNINQIVFFSSHIPRTKDLSFSRISFENTRGEILNWITMDIFVLWNLFRRKKKTLRDTVRIITEKKAKDTTHVLCICNTPIVDLVVVVV